MAVVRFSPTRSSLDTTKIRGNGQDAGKMLLSIEARIGELLPSEEETRKTGAPGGAHRTLPDEFGDNKNVRRHRAAQARTIARHPEAVAFADVCKKPRLGPVRELPNNVNQALPGRARGWDSRPTHWWSRAPQARSLSSAGDACTDDNS